MDKESARWASEEPDRNKIQSSPSPFEKLKSLATIFKCRIKSTRSRVPYLRTVFPANTKEFYFVFLKEFALQKGEVGWNINNCSIQRL